MKKKLVFATNNAHKLDEISSILGEKVELLSLKDIHCHVDIPETADTLEGNAMLKAEYIYKNYGLDCFADDTGLEVEALNGAPGVYSARIMRTELMQLTAGKFLYRKNLFLYTSSRHYNLFNVLKAVQFTLRMHRCTTSHSCPKQDKP